MFIRLDLETGESSLREAEDFTRFHIEAEGDRHDVRAAIGEAARLGLTHHLWLSIEWVRRLAERMNPKAEWWENFEGMLTFAASHGWIGEGGTHVQVHVESPEGGIVRVI